MYKMAKREILSRIVKRKIQPKSNGEKEDEKNFNCPKLFFYEELDDNNPYKVVSFTGVPFSVKNCLMGMRVIIGKHRMFKGQLF